MASLDSSDSYATLLISTTMKLLLVLTFAVMYVMAGAAAKKYGECPFDCTKVCIVKQPYSCNVQIHECCKQACVFYQKCVFNEQRACYAVTLDYICKCRKL